jgi:large subunit ribosomal protein L21
VEPGMLLEHELLPQVEVGEAVEFDKVLLWVTDEGVQIGTPYLAGVTVKGEVKATGRGEKIIIYKYKPKKGYRRKQGHRQGFMTTSITSIGG